MTDNSHLVLSQSTGLIGTNYLSTTKGLNCGKSTNNSVTLAHSGNTHRKNDGNNSNKTLWNCSYCKRNCNHKRTEDKVKVAKHLSAVLDKSCCKDKQRDDNNKNSKCVGKLIKGNLKWSLSLFCLRDCVCNLTHLSVHACCNNNCTAASIDHNRSGVAHILSVTQRNIICAFSKTEGLRVFLDRN